MTFKKIFFIFLFIFFLITTSVFAQNDNQISDLQKKINEYQQKLIELRQQKNTLSSQIQYMDTQIYLTTLKIQETEGKIKNTEKEIDILESKIGNLDESLNKISKLLINKIVENYKQKKISLINFLLNSHNANEFFLKLKYIKTARNNNQKLLIQVQEAKLNFEEQKKLREEKITELENLKKTLNYQQADLNNQKLAKKRLLEETQNDEEIYQRLVNQAKSQLTAFSKFTQSQGGASILNNQTVCNDWGCYYNQRDSQWGNISLNNTSYTLASDGCLITSMAMIYTHYGYKNITPLTINSNPNNFASYYPAWLNYNINANGIPSSRIRININQMDQELENNKPVVVGIAYDSCYHNDGHYYADHFVVLTKKNGNDYLMHDPFTPNGNDISFYSKYSNICEIYKITF